MSASPKRRGRVVKLLQTPAEQWTPAVLAAALQTAIELELSTLPPYLCGWWSIEDQTTEAASLIHWIVLEEMLHLGLVCNMLVGIGGSPTLVSTIPTYPGNLPGGVRPDLTVYLSGLTKDYVGEVFMGIEYPEGGPVDESAYPTIGAFYDSITTAFEAVQPVLDPTNQLDQTIHMNGDLVGEIVVLSQLSDVYRAIGEIKEQGEGTSQSPDAVDFGGELAHYYKFGEIYNGMHYVQGADGKWGYNGPPPIPFPAAYPMAQVPAGGWTDAPPDTRKQLNAFNSAFTSLLQTLESAWGSGGKNALSEAIGQMFDLQGLGISLIQTSRAPEPGNYGPEFRVTV